MNELTEFEQSNIALFKDLKLLDNSIKELQNKQKRYKDELVKQMEQYNVKSIDNDFVKVTYVGPTQSTSVDLKAFKEKEPEEYDMLLNDYPKVTNRKGYVRIKVK
ncbi:hypothetical protein FYL20_08800 [Lactobacillus salivarius]|uniref:hypothetical protein n=1 Tax=Ligilactobacillus salivarius TaxID=1624 RepID=UPI00137015DA|nr:hypothetical protein [Ligilactobacillus salivarius]MYU49141.1 hypothetical protein [Ligilactobacillus salivarius]MYV19918.1 hypothetical protein [Ligilactobacillus salivarius]MYZ01914.1 hypothetical protein [Ligilactobacillus salivarius]UIP52222.1 hypothetical protein LZF92_04270 [Ligilactobacillus salivarius]WGT60811.1 hypothetical protein QHF15_03700 [Ligilactobacillus salivarius]